MVLTSLPQNKDSPDLACAERRRRVARLVYSTWTDGGADLSQLAPAWVDGRIDALSLYITLADHEEEEDDNKEERDDCSTSIDRYHVSELSNEEFFNRYMLPNRPVIIQGLADDWKATRSWTLPSSEKHSQFVPNLDYLQQTFGDCMAPVHVQPRPGFTPSRPIKQDMTMAEYAMWWKNHHRYDDDDNDDDNSSAVNSNEDDGKDDKPIWYLKDWKFVAAHPEYQAYEWPNYFQDDWLNGTMGHAYKFVYLGPTGSCTRLHADILMSYSWSTNVCGRKRWYLVPPQYSYLLYDCFGESLACHLHADVESGDGIIYPGLETVRKYAVEVIQEAGETIFVPSKWFHTVENLEPTLSINHNWLNGCNIHCSWEKVQSEIQALEISDPPPKVDEAGADSRFNSNNKDTSQVGDDLLSMWLIVSKKAHEILDQHQNQEFASMNLFNLNSILPVLRGIQKLIEEGKEQGLTARCECDVESLVSQVQSSIESLKAQFLE